MTQQRFSMGFRRRALVLAVVLALPAVVLACGGSSNNAGSNAGNAATKAGGGTQAALATTGPASSPAAGSEKPVQGGKLVFGLATEPTIGGLDPNVTSAAVTHRIIENIFDTLVTETPDFQFKPGLAQSWEISPDATTYTFHLKQGIKFHDGTDFNADAVKFNFDRAVDPATKSLYAKTLLGPYDNTAVVDPNTVRVTFKQGYAPFLDYASQAFLGIQSPAAVKQYGADVQNHPVGTGPFMFKEWVKTDHITLVKNPNYNVGSTNYQHSGAPYLDELDFKIVPELATRTAALQNGELDAIESVGTQDVARLKDDKNLQVLVANSPGSPFVLFMNESKPPFDDANVRQAFILGLDRDAITKTLYNGLYPKADGPLAPTTFAYDKSVAGMYPFDQTKAKALLDAAGWKPGSDGIRVKDGVRLTFKYLESDVDREKRHEIAEAAQAQWKEMGADVQVLYQSAAVNQQQYIQNDYGMGTISFVSSEPDILSTLYFSKNVPPGFNYARLNSPDVDQGLASGAQTADQAQRKSIYSTVQQTIMKNATIIPIYVFPYIMGARANVHGLGFDVRAYPTFYDAYKK